MSEESEKELKDWENRDDIEDDLYGHFIDYNNETGVWNWCDIGREGVRVWNLMFGDELEEGSPGASVFSAVASSASDGVYLAVAAALGVDVDDLKDAVSDWEQGGKANSAKSLGLSGFSELLASARQSRHEMDAYFAKVDP